MKVKCFFISLTQILSYLFQTVNISQCSSVPCVPSLLGVLLLHHQPGAQAGGVAVPCPDHARGQGHRGARRLQGGQGRIHKGCLLKSCSLLLGDINWKDSYREFIKKLPFQLISRSKEQLLYWTPSSVLIDEASDSVVIIAPSVQNKS